MSGSGPEAAAAAVGPGRPGGPPPVALSIAGSDSGGGAGVQADLKTFQRFHVYGASALTLVTAQDTRGVRALHLLPPELVTAQIEAVAGDLDVRAVKTGALGAAPQIEAVASALSRLRLPNVVVDPVMVAEHGARLLQPDAVSVLMHALLPRAALLTPNLYEAAALAGRPVETEAHMRDAARALRDLGAAAVLVTGGHLEGAEAVDVLCDADGLLRLAAPRVETRHTHGTGCTYAAAIAALLARGEPLREAVRRAKGYLSRAIAGAPGLGHGSGPLDHWAQEG